MNELWQRLWALCLLRLGPQDLPYSPELTRNLVLASVAADTVFVFAVGLDSPTLRVLFSLLLLLGMTGLLLGLRQRLARMAQTLAALAGSGLLFTALLLPLALFAAQVEPVEDPAQLGASAVLSAGLVLVLYGWSLMVRAHILRHALDLPRLAGGILSLGWFIVEIGLGNWLFGNPQ